MPRSSAPSTTAIAASIVAIALIVVGCASSGAAAEPASPAGAAPAAANATRATFDLTIDGGPAAGTYRSADDASLDVCSKAKDGSWRFMYGGGSPWTNLDLLVGGHAAEPGHASDVALEISAGQGYLWIDQGGFRGGDAKGRSRVAVEIKPVDAATTFVVNATTPNRTSDGDGEPSTLTLIVTCPNAA